MFKTTLTVVPPPAGVALIVIAAGPRGVAVEVPEPELQLGSIIKIRASDAVTMTFDAPKLLSGLSTMRLSELDITAAASKTNRILIGESGFWLGKTGAAARVMKLKLVLEPLGGAAGTTELTVKAPEELAGKLEAENE